MAAQNQTQFPNDSMPSDGSDASDDNGDGAFAIGREAHEATAAIIDAISDAPRDAPTFTAGMPRPVFNTSGSQGKHVVPDHLTEDTSDKTRLHTLSWRTP